MSKVVYFYRHVILRGQATGCAFDTNIANIPAEVDDCPLRSIEDAGDGEHFCINYKKRGKIQQVKLHYRNMEFCAPVRKGVRRRGKRT